MSRIKKTFSKVEKIKSKKEVSRIFNDGIFFYSEHLNAKIIKSNNDNQEFHKIGISVPKRLFKLAVSRNKLKRQIREAYRLNKSIIYSSIKLEVYNIFFIYKSKGFSNYQAIENDIVKLLQDINLHLLSEDKKKGD